MDHLIQGKVSVLTRQWYLFWRVLEVCALCVKGEELDKLTRRHFNFSILHTSVNFSVTENQFGKPYKVLFDYRKARKDD